MVGFYRFFLAALVLYSHLNYAPWSVAGYRINQGVYAVFCFYLISGYFTALIYHRFDGQGHTFKFYIDRFLRIMPTFWAVIFSAAAISLIRHEPSLGASYADSREFETWFRAALQPLNGILAYFFRGDFPYGYFFAFTPVASLALEVQYFALFPLLARMRSKWVVLLIVVITGLLINALFTRSPDVIENYTYRYLIGVLPTFLLGFLYYQHRHGPSPLPWWCRFECLGTVVGLTLLLSAALIRPPAAHWLAEMAFAMMTCPWLLMLAMRKSSSKLDHLAGYLSYGIFLVHIPVIRFGHLKGDSGLEFVVALAVATAISLVIHWMVEKPVLRWRHRRADHAPLRPDAGTGRLGAQATHSA